MPLKITMSGEPPIRPWQRHSIAMASEADACYSAVTTNKTTDIDETKKTVKWSNTEIQREHFV